MNSIKSHCYVTYETIEVAGKIQRALHHVVWPPTIGKQLVVEYSKMTAVEKVEKTSTLSQRKTWEPLKNGTTFKL